MSLQAEGFTGRKVRLQQACCCAPAAAFLHRENTTPATQRYMEKPLALLALGARLGASLGHCEHWVVSSRITLRLRLAHEGRASRREL